MNPQEIKHVPEALNEQQQQELLEKFDRESVTRNPINKSVRWFIAALAISYSLFHHYSCIFHEQPPTHHSTT